MKLRVKSLIAILYCISSAWAAQASPLDYKASLHTLILNEEPNFVKQAVGESCVKDLQSFYKSGKVISSPLMLKSYIVSAPAQEFYHYTDVQDYFRVSAEKDFKSIFAYLRNSPKVVDKPDFWYLYVAGDPVSSKGFGNILVKMKLRENALIYTSNNKSSSAFAKGGNEGDDEIEKELLRKYPELRACRGVLEDPVMSNQHPILVLLAAEAHQVDLIAYHATEKFKWYQVLGSWAFESMSAAAP